MEEFKYHYKYPHPAVTTDCVIFGYDGKQLKILLIERGNEPDKGKWAFPGGFLNIDEQAEAGALRELQEETGMKDADIRQFHTFSAPNRDPRERVISIAYYALVKIQDVKGGDDAARASWFAIDDVPKLAFDHDLMFKLAIEALRHQAYTEPVGTDILPEKFTLDDISQLYTAILGKAPIDYLLNFGLLLPDGETDKPLYTFGKFNLCANNKNTIFK